MRSNDESGMTENELELQVRVVQTLISSVEEIFGSDPAERYADPSFSSVTLMPDIRPSVTYEREYSKMQSSSATAVSLRSVWQSQDSPVPEVVSKCAEIIESKDWKAQFYYTGASEVEVIRAWSWLNSRKSPEVSNRWTLQRDLQLIIYCPSGSEPKPMGTKPFFPSPLAFATLMKELIAAKPNPLVALEDGDLAIMTTAEG